MISVPVYLYEYEGRECVFEVGPVSRESAEEYKKALEDAIPDRKVYIMDAY